MEAVVNSANELQMDPGLSQEDACLILSLSARPNDNQRSLFTSF